MDDYKFMDTWEKLAHLLKQLEWETDLKYDCLMQILSEELGDREMQSLHRKASERFASFQPTTKTESQPESTEKEREGSVRSQDDWRNIRT